MSDMRPAPVDPTTGSPFLTKAIADGSYAPLSVPSGWLNQRLHQADTPTFDASFAFSAISAVQDGWLTWKNLTVHAGATTPTYFKAVGGSIIHDGPGNLDVFWASVAHSGTREAGLFIGDLTSTAGGNAYGIHTRIQQDNLAPASIMVGYECEVIPNVARGTAQYYNILIQNSGSQPVSAGIQVETPAAGGGGKFDKGLNFDSTAASGSATAVFIGGVWGAGVDMNANAIVNAGSVAGTGTSPNRDVRVADNLQLDNGRYVKFKDSGGTIQKLMSVTAANNVRLKRVAAASQLEWYDESETTLLARITSSGRGDFSTGGVTTKYTSGAVQPGFTTNGQAEVWHDTGSGNDYLVVNSNGVSKKVAVA